MNKETSGILCGFSKKKLRLLEGDVFCEFS